MCTTHLCPWKTSCDSSMIFHTLTVRSFMPAVTGRSRLRQSMDDTLSWWPNLRGGEAEGERESRAEEKDGRRRESGEGRLNRRWVMEEKKKRMGTPRRMERERRERRNWKWGAKELKMRSEGTENEDRGFRLSLKRKRKYLFSIFVPITLKTVSLLGQNHLNLHAITCSVST